MLSASLKYGQLGSEFCGIEHTIFDGQGQLNILVLKKKKEEFLIEHTFTCNTPAELTKQLQKNQHLFLIINDHNVLFKKLDGVYDTQTTINISFPNIKIKEFYYEIYTTTSNTYISICRKDYVDKLLLTYTANRLHVVGFSLGNLSVTQLVNLIDNTTISTSNGTITFSDQKIDTITITTDVDLSESYEVNGLTITKNEVLPLTGILAYYTQQTTTVSNFSDTIKQLHTHFNQKRIFDIGLKMGLSIIFILLVISYLMFANYYEKTAMLTTELELHKTYKKSIISLDQEVSKKERMVNDLTLESSRVSWYLDQIVGYLPNSILLTELQYQPPINNIKEDQEILIQEHQISIKGTTNNSSDFSNFINTLNQINWIEKVTILEYGDPKNTMTQFNLLISLKK
mgnify:CR=1 FL=1